MKINNGREDCVVGEKGIKYFEEKYNAKYIADLCLKTVDGGWVNEPAAIFYQETPPQPEYSNYFAVFVRNGKTYITSGKSTVEGTIAGIESDDGEVIFSRYRHDYRQSKDGSVFIDGGRDYVKSNNPSRLVEIKIDGDEMVILPKLKTSMKLGKPK
ncbi:hypothetical protein GW796_08230 [archaeon]|nr:hypothetical protein [archaeon]